MPENTKKAPYWMSTLAALLVAGVLTLIVVASFPYWIAFLLAIPAFLFWMLVGSGIVLMIEHGINGRAE